MRKETSSIGMWLVAAAAGAILLAAACLAEEPTAGTLDGVLAAKGEAWIEVKADGQETAKRYLPIWRGGAPKDGGGFDKDTLAAIRKLVVPNRVHLAWKQDEHLRIVSVAMLVPEEKSGSLSGTVTAKGETWIEIKGDGGAVERYWPRWIGGNPKDGGGFDREMVQRIGRTPVGASVKIQWTYDERKRVTRLD